MDLKHIDNKEVRLVTRYLIEKIDKSIRQTYEERRRLESLIRELNSEVKDLKVEVEKLKKEE